MRIKKVVFLRVRVVALSFSVTFYVYVPKIIFVDDVTSYDTRCKAVHFMYLSFCVPRNFMFFVTRWFYVFRRRLIFVFIHERMFKGIRMIALRLFDRLLGFLTLSSQLWSASVFNFVSRSGGWFECDIDSCRKERESVYGFQNATSIYVGKIMFDFPYLWWGC